MHISNSSKTLIRRAFYSILFLIAFNTLEHTCHKLTDGFSLSRIQFPSQKNQASAHPPHPELLSQPYYYYGCGHQCFAFISEDGQTILKFFKYADHAPPSWTAKIPLLNRIKSFRPCRIQYVLWKKERDFKGYMLAFEQFKEESGLLDLHLRPTTCEYPTLTLYDKLSIRHQLDLNKVPFVLQRKAIPAYTQFSHWIANGDIEKARRAITEILSLCSHRISQQIDDYDADFHSNLGFFKESPIYIDPGRFSLSSTPLPSAEFERLKSLLKTWFSKHYPPLVSDVEACQQTP